MKLRTVQCSVQFEGLKPVCI